MYIADDNIAAAERVLRAIGGKCDLVAEHPDIGRDRSELLESVRSFPVGNYIVFYRSIPGGIVVLRVLHRARDVAAIF